MACKPYVGVTGAASEEEVEAIVSLFGVLGFLERVVWVLLVVLFWSRAKSVCVNQYSFNLKKLAL